MSSIIRLAHGSGGEMTQRLIEDVFYKAFGGKTEDANDSAIIDLNLLSSGVLSSGKIAFTTDSFVISPLFFPGGDIGKLAFCGTVNDLAAAGAKPIALSASFIIEEGMPIEEVERIVESMGLLSEQTQIPIIAGDTKVVDHGSADKIFITTSGIGIIPQNIDYQPKNIKQGDKIIVSGTIGDHGYCIMAIREGIDIKSEIKSDCQPLHELVNLLKPLSNDIRCARDATRGGVGMVLNEWAKQSDTEILIYESLLPIKDEVKGGCALLGLDPIYLANEGKMVFCVANESADKALSILRSNSYGSDAAIIGEVVKDKKSKGLVIVETQWGTQRILPTPKGEILPRIC